MKHLLHKWLLLCSVFVLVLSSPAFVGAKGNPDAQKGGASWDKSSLSFISEGGNCEGIWAEVQNGSGSKVMQGISKYEVYWIASGNPKSGQIVAEGEISPLQSGESFQLKFDPTTNPNGAAGNYMFKAYQREGHPGKGELWSGTITVSGPCDTPGNGDNPGNGETPGNGDNPSNGETPGNGDNPGNGETPGNGDNPGNGETPGNGDNPGNGDTPGNGDNPNGDTPSNGDTSNGDPDNKGTQQPEEKEGFSLPDTATKYPMMILIGLAVAVVGGLLFFFSRKKIVC
ncbi:LPXTG cell wall anchor domain-containing protein [Hazenella coriacea]|uniref:YqxM protein n=1 Tax=Hazenella coriacea TaxID=1179467 RepID=A0A4R3L3M8_9BACL|nr:LPXTG cell wall anchor domain-containing protein [Hazenella coriacea]TCS93260.1 YqxM protein [Hazenella coriacea]